MIKTNAMRILDKQKKKYIVHEYECDGGIDGLSVANKLNQDPNKVYKTLITQGNDKNYYVFVVPILKELDLKKAAKAVQVKSIHMIAVKDINIVSGYVRGGCSPIGMKKQYLTTFDESITSIDTVYVSGGKIGVQIEITPNDLISCCKSKLNSICSD